MIARHLTLVEPDVPPQLTPSKPANEAHWLVNNYPAIVTVWTPQEWAMLSTKPIHAQQCPNGLVVLLRIA